MIERARSFSVALIAACLLAAPSIAKPGFSRSATLLDALERTDGAQALVAAVLVVDGASGTSVNYESTVIVPDLSARNGFAHFVDSVILDGLL